MLFLGRAAEHLLDYHRATEVKVKVENKNISFDYSMAEGFLTPEQMEKARPRVEKAHTLLHGRRGPGNEFTGWLDLPGDYDRREFTRIKDVAARIGHIAEVLIVIGIGGSYLGARSALEALKHTFYHHLPSRQRKTPMVFFAGHHVSGTYLTHLLDLLRDRDIAVNVVSKSGTTLEPALAFRVFRKVIEERYGRRGVRERIVATTDREKGILREMAAGEGFETFVVPDDVGGRFSVLTAVGLLPMAVGGIDIDRVMEGAEDCRRLCANVDLDANPAYQYAAARNLLHEQGKTTEILVNYEPSLYYFGEWWKQLFGESEGKDGKGIFPATLNFSTDLHSMGQYLQEGRRDLFATTIWMGEAAADMVVPEADEDKDRLNYLAGRSFSDINEKIRLATMQAHSAGGVPNLMVKIGGMTPYHYGQMVYFFEKACAISGYLLGVNPFDQPGVEAYKKRMFALLGRP